MEKKGIKDLETKHPLSGLRKAEEITQWCLILASDKSSFSTDDYYLVDGGYSAFYNDSYPILNKIIEPVTFI